MSASCGGSAFITAALAPAHPRTVTLGSLFRPCACRRAAARQRFAGPAAFHQFALTARWRQLFSHVFAAGAGMNCVTLVRDGCSITEERRRSLGSYCAMSAMPAYGARPRPWCYRPNRWRGDHLARRQTALRPASFRAIYVSWRMGSGRLPLPAAENFSFAPGRRAPAFSGAFDIRPVPVRRLTGRRSGLSPVPDHFASVG